MDYTKYYKAREEILEIMSIDLLGPLSKDEIICDEWPLDYYIVGKLYPRQNDADDVIQSPADDCGELDEEDNISLSNSRNPSSFGLSISLNENATYFEVHAKAAKYELIDRIEAQGKLQFEDKAYKSNALFWKRKQLDIPIIKIDVESLNKGKSLKLSISENLSLNILLHKIYPDGSKTITVTMLNESYNSQDYATECVNSFFQPEILITSKEKNAFGDVRRNVDIDVDPEIKELNMLYSSVFDYASGYGCAADWKTDDEGNVLFLKTDFLPQHEVRQMMPTSNFKHDVLGMKYLSEQPSDKVIAGLKQLTDMYETWISEQEEKVKLLDNSHHASAYTNLQKCRLTNELLNKSIEELRNPIVFKAFSLANKAMFKQRKKMLKNTNKNENDEAIKWYPFQLSFFLKEIYSYTQPDSD